MFKNLLSKIIVFIAVPVAATYCIVAAISLGTVKKTLNDIMVSDLTSKSQAASYQIDGFFSKYFEVARQMAANDHIRELFLNIKPGMDMNTSEGIGQLKHTFDTFSLARDTAEVSDQPYAYDKY